MALKEDKVQVTVLVDGKQAINELGKHEMAAYEARQEMKGLKKGTEEYKAANDKLKDADKNVKRLREEMGTAGMTLKQLSRYQRDLNNELGNLTKGTARYNEVKAKLQDVNKVIAQQKAEVRGLTSVWGSMKTEVKQFGILAASYLGLEFLGAAIGNIIKGNAKLSDSLADIRKTTGMTTEEVKGLNSELSKIDTRTGSAALREIAIVGGQIGVAKEEMLGFVEATDMAVVALGDEFQGGAEQVAREIGSIQRLFKQTKDMDAGEAIRKIGSALNELGAAGSATAPEVADFAKRLGPLGNMAPQISETLGLGAAFQELGLSAEISSGGLTNILLKASKETANFAKFLDMPLAKFKDLINNNPNEALLVMADRFKGLSNDQVGKVLEKLGINSQEATKVMGLLAEKTDFVREKQKLAADAIAENTSLQEENNVKQATFGALIDRLSKKLNSFVNNQGFVNFLTSAAENAYKLLVFLQGMPKFINDNKVAIGALAVAIMAFNAQEIILNALILKEAIARRIQTIATMHSTVAQHGLNAAMKANPIGFVVGLVMLLVGAFATLYTNSQNVRAAVDGIYQSLKAFVINIKDNVIGYLEGLGDIFMGIFTLDGDRLKAGLKKTLKSAFALSPVGLAADSGKKMADAFNKGYNDRIKLENGTGNGNNSPFAPKSDPFSKFQPQFQGPTPPGARTDKPAATADEIANQKAAARYLAEEAKKNSDKLKAKKEQDRIKKEKEAADEVKRQIEAVRLLEDAQLALQKDGFEKRRKQAMINSDREKEDLMAEKKLTGELEKALNAKLRQELDQIALDEAAKKKEDALKNIDNKEASDTADVETEFLAKDYEAKLKNSAILELEIAQWKQQELWRIEAEGIQARMDMLVGNDEQTVFQREQLQARLDQLAVTSKTAALQYERARADQEIQLQQQKYDAAYQIVGSYGNAIMGLMETIGASSSALIAFQKGVAFAQILIDTARAISSVIAASASTSITPIDLAVKIAAGVGTVMTNIAAAKKLLGGAEAPAAPSFFYGGDTGDSGLGYGDKYGEYSGFVHKKEYVIDAVTRRDPQVANYEGIIESKRSGLRPNRVAESQANSSTGASTAAMESLMAQMVAEQKANRDALNSFRGRLKADVSLFDLDEKEKERDMVQSETRF